jgi:plastocyanin
MAAGLTVGVSLLSYGQSNSRFGTVGGYSPALVVVAVGTTIQFHNQDSFDHTATDILGSSFPPGNPIPSSALVQSGTDVAQSGWSSGTLTAGAYSQVLKTSTPGTYLFGCFYHYPTMRGAIIVE